MSRDQIDPILIMVSKKHTFPPRPEAVFHAPSFQRVAVTLVEAFLKRNFWNKPFLSSSSKTLFCPPVLLISHSGSSSPRLAPRFFLGTFSKNFRPETFFQSDAFPPGTSLHLPHLPFWASTAINSSPFFPHHDPSLRSSRRVLSIPAQ